MKNLIEEIKQGKVFICDGAMGTLLQQKGLRNKDCPESINLSNPRALEQIAEEYFEAGSEIIQTNSFGGSSIKLSNHNLQSNIKTINMIATSAVKRVVGDKAYVSASVGPCGKLLKPFGDLDPDVLFRSFCEQIEALIEGGADIICIETMTDLNEAVLALKAAKSVHSKIPVITSMTFNKTPRGYFTLMGNEIKDVAENLIKEGADILGSNCGNGIENMLEIAQEFKEHTDHPLIIQSNAGIPELDNNGNLTFPESEEFFAKYAKKIVDTGVSIIGGCCGTGPEYIREIKKTINTKERIYE